MKTLLRVNFAVLAALGLLSRAGSSRASGTDSQASTLNSGAELWQENCTMCHESKPRISFTPEKVDSIKRHMREKADLSPDEQEAVLEFLRSEG
jgi:hypothetical protein